MMPFRHHLTIRAFIAAWSLSLAGLYAQEPRQSETHRDTVVVEEESGGLPRSVTSYNERGQWHGPHLTFDGQGRLKTREEYRNGLPHGIFKRFDNQGKIREEAHYAEGRYEGRHKKYYGNQKLQSDIAKKDGKNTARPSGTTAMVI